MQTFELSIDLTQCKLTSSQGESFIIPISPLELINSYFKSTQITDLELEYAIASVEDVVMPLDKKLSINRHLISVRIDNPELNLRELFEKETIIHLDEFEVIFNKALLKRDSKKLIATLLIIREIAHHLRFNNLAIGIKSSPI